jgi:N-methylhydantoinase B
MGAGTQSDGLCTTGFPTNAGGGSIEVLESVTPIVFWKRELLQDSGGPGRRRGGLGQRVEIESIAEHPVDALFQFDRVDHPAAGLFGGLPGGRSRLSLNGSTQLPSKGRVTLNRGDRLHLDYAGGGGYGPPKEREAAAVAADLRNGFISKDAAHAIYRPRGVTTR